MPGTAANNNSRKSEVELVSERVSKTKKEIEQLKAQLQKLINDGMSKTDFTETKQNVAALSNEHKTVSVHNQLVKNKVPKTGSDVDINRAKAFKDNVANLILPRPSVSHSNIPPRQNNKSMKQETKDVSPKKIRHYDQEAAREYIKKQKEKRREQMKTKKKDVDFTQDIKKQRLEELRQKSLQLVSKNVQHKRERSRSRSRDSLDHSDVKRIEISGEKVAQIHNRNDAQANNKSVKAKSDLVPNLIESKSELQKKQVKFAHPQLKNITVRSSLRDLSAIPRLDIPKHLQFDDDLSVQAVHSIPVAEPASQSHSITSNLPIQLLASEKQLTSAMQSSSLVLNTKKIISESSMQPSKRHIAATKIQAAFRGYRQRKLYQLTWKMKQKSKDQATKEVQTVEIKENVPIWLQPPTALPYPYNFINTVKRKLNLAIQQITTMNDVAVQSSFVQEKNVDKIEKSLEEKISQNKNTDLKSFLSHKCLDVDMKTVEPLVLTKNSSIRDKKVTLHDSNISKPELNGFASDSDTSKNIPEISSESSVIATHKQHSSKRSHSSDTDHDDRPKINMDRIKKLKFLQPKQLNFSSESAKSQSVEISEHIDGNNSAVKERSRTSSKSSLKSFRVQNDYSGRDSIIASNKCDYSQSITKKHSDVDKNQHELSEHGENMIEPIIHPQDTLSSFRSYMENLYDKKQISNNSLNVKAEVAVKKPENLNQLKNSTEKSQDQGTFTNTHSTIPLSVPSVNCSTETKTSNKIAQITLEELVEKSEKASSKIETEILPSSHSQSEKRESTFTAASLGKNSQEYSNNFASVLSTVSPSVPLLTHPKVSLRSSQQISGSEETDVDDHKAFTSITLKSGEKTAVESKVKSNEIHLKFEAELHLLNDFNDSLRQVMAMEKSLMHLHNDSNNISNSKIATTYQTRDTQTSFVSKSPADTKISTESPLELLENQSNNKVQNQIPTINYSRGSEISQMNIFSLENTVEGTNDTSLITTGLELSQIKDNMLTSSIEESNVDDSVSFAKDNCKNGNMYTGLSIEMFEQLIRDEDARIENLKTILKIREKALVDRTKGELAWLEIQKKHLRDSGQLREISAIKKKQRGLLIKLEHERHEMQRLKQMQKAASKERKSVLREQRNMIKAQLSNTNNMITKIKRNTKEERRQSGPLKVYNIKSRSESIRSETSMSRRSSVTEEIISVVSHSQSVVSHVTEEVMSGKTMQQKKADDVPVSSTSQIKTEHVKRSLLMREAALQKRRKAAEELLQWHQRLVEEEGKIAELEQAASAIINQVPTITNGMVSDETTAEKHKFKGSQLNLLWYNMTGREEKKFDDHVTYSMTKISLERFCKDAKKYAMSRSKGFNNKKGGKISDSDSSLSAVDVTVTELTQNQNNSRNLKNSSNEKSRRSKSRNSYSSSEISSHIITSKAKDSQDYTSDFESLLPINKESGLDAVSSDDEQKIPEEMLLSDHSEVSKKSVTTFLSDKDNIEITVEKDKTENLSDQSKTNHAEIIEEKLSTNEESAVEIIDDNSTTTNKFSKKINKQSDDSVSSDFNSTKISYSLNENVSKNTDNLESVPLKVSADSTSKDITTNMENEASKTNVDIKETSEIVESINHKEESTNEANNINVDIEETSEIIESINHKEGVTNEANDRNVDLEETLEHHSLNKTSEEIVSEFESKSTETTNKTNEEILSDFKSSNVQVTISEKNESNNTNPDLLIRPKDRLIRLDDEDLSASTDKNHPHNSANAELLSKVCEDVLVETENELVDKTDEDQLVTETNEIHLLGQANEAQLDETDDLRDTTDQLLSETSEIQLLSEESEVQSRSRTNEDQLEMKNNQIKKPKENRLHSRTDEDEAYLNIKNKNEFSNEINDNQQLTTIEDQLSSQTSENLSLNKNLVKPVTEINSSQVVTTISEDEITVKTDEDHQFSIEAVQVNLQNGSEKSTKSSNSEKQNKVSLENRSSKLNTETDEIITVPSENNSKTLSYEEGNELSNSSSNQELNKKCRSLSDEGTPKFDENLHAEEDSTNIISVSISKKTESPLLLSYGFVEKEKPTGKAGLEESASVKDHIEDSIQDTLTGESNIPTEDVDYNFEEESEIFKVNKNKTFKNNLEENKFEDNVKERFEDPHKDEEYEVDLTQRHENIEYKDHVNQTFENHSQNIQFESCLNQISNNHHLEKKPDINLNQTYQGNLEETSEHKLGDNYEDNRTNDDFQKKTKTDEHIDVKKRVSKILADANIPSPWEDKSPRLQDLYVTAYDVVSPEHSSSGSPTDDIDRTFMPPCHMYGNEEVEELLKKQLEIEQEIKEIQQQQKEHLPYLYVREIPNKPPPPYTPPGTIQTPVTGSVLPANEKQIVIIAKWTANILHNAYLNKNLQNVSVSTEDLKIMQNKNNIDKNCLEFVFDLCKEAAIDHYKQFETEVGPSWMRLTKRSKLAIGKPFSRNGLEELITMKVRQWLGYETVKSAENIKRKWSGKKRDHVDDLLVVECQAEESEWTNYDRDELIVKDELTKDIMNMLLSETAQIFNNILNKKTFLC